MHQSKTDDEPGVHEPTCAELAKAAEREFSAFFYAVAQQFGNDEARIWAICWLEEFLLSRILPNSVPGFCRAVTISVASRVPAGLFSHEKAYAGPATE